MITTEVMGGLGNQLYQIFCLISYSIDNDITFFIQDKSLTEGDRRKTYWDNLLLNLKSYFKPVRNLPVLNWFQHHYIELPKITDKDFKLMGYFQSYKYFHHNIDKIEGILKLNDIKNKYKNKYDYKNIVSLHFRIGDYVKLQDFHHLLSIDYYINVLGKLIKDTNRNDWNILYFYEESDKDMIDKNINILKEKYDKLNFIGIDHKLDDWEQMLCMSLCKHNIIANSTFSWWGAYFNENNNRIYYPNKWFGPKLENNKMDDLFLDEWVKIYI